jgi:hypothetical protein
VLDLQHDERAGPDNPQSGENFPDRVLHGNPSLAPNRFLTPFASRKGAVQRMFPSEIAKSAETRKMSFPETLDLCM